MIIKETMFDVFKDGVKQNVRVGVVYNENNKREKLERLMADYPESEGYKLVIAYERKW